MVRQYRRNDSLCNMIVVACLKKTLTAFKKAQIITLQRFTALQQVDITFGRNVKAVFSLADQTAGVKSDFFAANRALQQILYLIKLVYFVHNSPLKNIMRHVLTI